MTPYREGRTSERIVATIEARRASSRFPDKVLREVCGRPLLSIMVERVRQSKLIDDIVLATTVHDNDGLLAEFAAREKIACFRGSEADVMARVIGAAEAGRAEIVVELTGDCPLIDPRIIDQTVRMFLQNPCDYLSNSEVRSYPDGMDVQVYRIGTLRRSAAMTSDPLDREHVTRHILRHAELFSRIRLVAPPELHWPELGLTLDEPADLELIDRIVRSFQPESFQQGGRPLNLDFSCLDILRVLRERHPEWVETNRHVKRKGLDQ